MFFGFYNNIDKQLINSGRPGTMHHSPSKEGVSLKLALQLFTRHLIKLKIFCRSSQHQIKFKQNIQI